MHAISSVRHHACYYAAAEAISLGGANRECDIIGRIRENDGFIEGALTREHNRCNNRDDTNHHHEFDEREPGVINLT